SCVPGELIPCAFVWHDPGITPCCKSPKLPGDDFLAVRRSDRLPPTCVISITLSRSPVSLSSGDEVPHIFTRKSRLQPGEFLITSAKRLLQQYLPKADYDRTVVFRRKLDAVHPINCPTSQPIKPRNGMGAVSAEITKAMPKP